MNWLTRSVGGLFNTKTESKRQVTEGVWSKCSECQQTLYTPDLERNLYVCNHCGHHQRIGARQRLEYFLDKGEFNELGNEYSTTDPLKFRDSKRYKDRISEANKSSSENEALLVGQGKLEGRNIIACAFEFRFLGGSMGQVVGARFVAAVEAAIKQSVPLVCFSASGGARMQEGLFSLMQMARTSAAVAKMRDSKLPYISVLTDPTYGGVSASLALLGDINIAEPRANIGFAGKRVIEQTVRQKLPEDFQRSEFLLEHGAIDMIVNRKHLRPRIANLLNTLMHAR